VFTTSQGTGGREYSSDLEQGGLQIPCTLCFTGDKNWLEKLAQLLKSGKQPDAADSSSSVRFKQPDKLNCEPVKIKEEVTVDEACSSGNLDNGVWVKCDKSVLKCEDKKIIKTGGEMTDKIIQYSQYLVKKQFSTIGGLYSTFLQSRHKGRLPDNSLQVVYCGARHHWILASNTDCKKEL